MIVTIATLYDFIDSWTAHFLTDLISNYIILAATHFHSGWKYKMYSLSFKRYVDLLQELNV